MSISPSQRNWRLGALLALGLAVLVLVVLLPLGCGKGEPSRPIGGDPRDYAAPPTELPDDFPAGGANGDSSAPGDPGQNGEFMLACLRAYHDPVKPNIGLWVMSTGLAAAMSPGDSLRMMMSLSADTLALIEQWFNEARFNELVGTYLSDHPMQVRVYHVTHQQSPMGPTGLVQGQEDLLPAEIRTLCERLEGLAQYVLEHGEAIPDEPTEPPPPPDVYVHGDLEVEPVSAAIGTPRTIRLYLRNSGTEAVTLHFPTTQVHDFLLMSGGPWDPPGHDGPGDPGMPGGGGPCDPNHPGGNRGDDPNEPGDPDDPTDPPDSTGVPGDSGIVVPPPPDSGWVPPDSGWVPPDSGWVPPPDTVWVPPDSGWVPPDSLPPGPGGVLWSWSSGLAFPEVLTEVVVGPGQVLSYEVTWNGNDNDGNPVGAGVYVIHGLVPSRERVPVVPVRVEVTE